MSEEKEFNLSIEDFEMEDDESPLQKLRRDAPVMATFVDAVKDNILNSRMSMPMAWTPPKFEFCVEQLEFGAPELTQSISKLLNERWEVFKTESYRQWLVVIFARKVEKVDSQLDK